MHLIPAEQIYSAVLNALTRLAFGLDTGMRDALRQALGNETDETARDVLQTLLENADISERERIPYCQDTGMVVVFAEIGSEVRIAGALLDEIINSAVSDGWKANYLRPSLVRCPLSRLPNSGDNTPAVIHHRTVGGDRLRLLIALKGGGAENMSTIRMFPPTASKDELLNFITETVIHAGAKACPPLILGIGIGGNFESAALNAKRALFVPLNELNTDEEIASLEREIMERVNATGIGAQGMGGRTTALAAHIISAPCHIASLPVAINLQCHAHRHIELNL